MGKLKTLFWVSVAFAVIGIRLAIFDPFLWQHFPIVRGFSLAWLIAISFEDYRNASKQKVVARFGTPDEGSITDALWIYKLPTLTTSQGAFIIIFTGADEAATVSGFRILDSY